MGYAKDYIGISPLLTGNKNVKPIKYKNIDKLIVAKINDLQLREIDYFDKIADLEQQIAIKTKAIEIACEFIEEKSGKIRY